MHKRIKRLFSLVVAFVLLLSSVLNASALTEGSNYSFNTAYTQVYYDWGSYQTADGAYHSASGQLALRTLKSTGEPIYCLQAHKGTDSSSATAASIKGTYAWKEELSRIAQTGITWASIYGYRGNGINTYGYSADNAQIATQMLIWEWQTTRRTSVSADASNYVTKAISGDALACYNKILEACRNHKNVVTWDKTSVTLNAVGESNAQYFTDTSNRLSGFEISSNSNSSVVGASISGNKLKVWAKSATAATANIQLTKKMTNIGSAMCLTGAGQTMFYGAVRDPVYAGVTVNVQGTGTMKLQNCWILIKYSVEYTPEAIKQLKKFDKYVQKLIYAWIDKNLQGCENPRIHGKALTANRTGQWRYRVGDYRLIAEIQDEKVIILILNIGHRRDIYKEKRN